MFYILFKYLFLVTCNKYMLVPSGTEEVEQDVQILQKQILLFL